MLFNVEDKTLITVAAQTLKDLDLLEKDLEELLYNNIQNVIRQTELFAFAHSRNWQEEPDILALDKDGVLYIFELKAWESRKDNLLQVMRYAQMFSEYSYERLNKLWQSVSSKNTDLRNEHQNYFDLEHPIERDLFNKEQSLVVMTNGLDSGTRQAVKYWRGQGVKISPWIYRAYQINNQKFLSFEAFGTSDDPYEDLAVSYHIVNTCAKDSMDPHNHMLDNKRASAFYSPWKDKIKNIKKSDTVFLYQSGIGIVAYGKAKDTYKSAIWEGHEDEEFYVELNHFKRINPPLEYAELKEIVGYPIAVIGTHTPVRKEGGEALLKELKNRIATSS